MNPIGLMLVPRPRVISYQRETLTRFKKELVTAAVPGVDFTRNDYKINVESINTILMNIGVPEEKKLTKDELDTILRDAGVDSKNDRSIPLTKMMTLL